MGRVQQKAFHTICHAGLCYEKSTLLWWDGLYPKRFIAKKKLGTEVD
jgi:hypothetical protein